MGYLGGNNGTINGNVILHGELNPGESPGRIIINGGLHAGSGHLVLDVAARGNSHNIDHLILTQGSSFSFTGLEVTFNFLGDVNPNVFANSGQFDLDNFLQSLGSDGNTVSGLSSQFTHDVRPARHRERAGAARVGVAAAAADVQVRGTRVGDGREGIALHQQLATVADLQFPGGACVAADGHERGQLAGTAGIAPNHAGLQAFNAPRGGVKGGRPGSRA